MRNKSFKTSLFDSFDRFINSDQKVEIWFEMDDKTIRQRASQICDSQNDEHLEKEVPLIQDAIIIEN